VDAIVFSGGIGERSVELRAAVGERCACLGVEVEKRLNEGASNEKGSVVEIGNGAVKAMVCRTDEQVC
jgi:acetate kinase